MQINRAWFFATAAAAVLGLLAQAAPSLAQGKMPPFVVIGVNEGGGALNALGNGLAKLITERAGTKARLRTTTGGTEILVNAGDADFGMGVSVETYQSMRGLDHYAGKKQSNVRLVASGPSLIVAFMVKNGAPFKSVADLRGAKVGGEYPGTRPLHFDGVALLAGTGMTWKDVEVVPVATLGSGIQTFIEGKIDAVLAAVGTAFVQKADASLGGVRFLTLPAGPEVASRVAGAEPGFYALEMRKGAHLGVDRDMILGAKDIYFNSGAKVSEDAVYGVVKAMWNDMSSLHTVNPMFRAWTHQAMVKPDVTAPYHAGAVRFYKETGAWTDAMEKAQQALLKQVGN